MIRVLAIALLIFVSSIASAIDAGKAFEDPDLQARYESIIAEVRCVKCQNQTIKDSNALIANDLRREIRRLISEGNTDAQIYDFLVQRYGDFVLYRPRMSGATLWLWIAPAAFFLIGAIIAIRVVRKRMSMPIDFDDDVDQVAS